MKTKKPQNSVGIMKNTTKCRNESEHTTQQCRNNGKMPQNNVGMKTKTPQNNVRIMKNTTQSRN